MTLRIEVDDELRAALDWHECVPLGMRIRDDDIRVKVRGLLDLALGDVRLAYRQARPLEIE